MIKKVNHWKWIKTEWNYYILYIYIKIIIYVYIIIYLYIYIIYSFLYIYIYIYTYIYIYVCFYTIIFVNCILKMYILYVLYILYMLCNTCKTSLKHPALMTTSLFVSAPGLRRLRAETLALIILRRAFGASAPKTRRSALVYWQRMILKILIENNKYIYQ